MKKSIIASVSIFCLLLAGGCVSRKEQPSKHKEWLESLNDSIADMRMSIDSINYLISELNDSVAGMLGSFERVDNPRYVEGFTIFKGWSKKYPLTSTGLVARMKDDENLELIAALRGGTFTEIDVAAGGEHARSETMPYDKALNYRSGNLNTVAFSGGKADTIAMLIAGNPNVEVIVTFSGKNSHKLTAGEKEMIGATYRLVAANKESKRLQRILPVAQEKIRVMEQMALPKEEEK